MSSPPPAPPPPPPEEEELLLQMLPSRPMSSRMTMLSEDGRLGLGLEEEGDETRELRADSKLAVWSVDDWSQLRLSKQHVAANMDDDDDDDCDGSIPFPFPFPFPFPLPLELSILL